MALGALLALGGASIVSGFLGAQAAERAAGAQTSATRAGIAEQRRQFDMAQEQQAPFREAGVGALAEQQALLGLSGEEAGQQAMQRFTESPGQQFLRAQQEKSLLRSASAIGGLGGGNVRTTLQEQAFGRAQTNLSDRLNRLAALSGTGQTSTAQLGQLGGQTAANIANLQQAGGAARASGILGQQQALSGTIQNVAGIAALSGAFQPQPGITPAPAGQPQAGGLLGRI